jgi:2-polyprenyl-6-hydroxyphenyl methylase / 3-demethylubiquinone-9 3-methyltransferase
MSAQTAQSNVHAREVAHFGSFAARWWDPNGPSRALLDINPTRMAFVERNVKLAGLQVLDVGCGGGILSETLAIAGAQVVAIDLSAELIEVAQLHALSQSLQIDYRVQSVEQLADSGAQFDVICCMDMLEHVPQPEAILSACARMLKRDGTLLLSTINRTMKAFALAILGAEYLLNIVPKGSHRHSQFIKPSELASTLRGLDMRITDQAGLAYQPFSRKASLVQDSAMNYLLAARHC